ncbi:hypothetical protein [Mesorhizobium sp. L2C084A000]|nr:hypothetical protein [Mesorhizobium sp. L2C084A000]ESZ19333.1 hypothetical protein X734_32525 [Mesorhizobium sp. L2C084A000]
MDDISVVTDFPRKVREIENVWILMADGPDGRVVMRSMASHEGPFSATE